MKPLKLRAHGKFSIEKIDNLLIVHAEGPGNIELAENYHQQMSKYVTDLAGKPWGSVNVFSQESFFTPDASENLIAGAKYAKKIGFVACTFVIKADEFKNSLKSFWEMIYRSANVEHRFFESEEEAKVWLIEKLSEYE